MMTVPDLGLNTLIIHTKLTTQKEMQINQQRQW